MTQKTKPDKNHSEGPPNVMLPPIDATPEEIAQALVREVPPERSEAEDADS